MHSILSAQRSQMLSAAGRTALIDLCQSFISSGDEITLAHLVDAVNDTISDRESQDWKDWSKYMEVLNETWVSIVKENMRIPWPEVSIMSSYLMLIMTYS